MSRKPRLRISRRLGGVDLSFTSGVRPLKEKCKLEQRPGVAGVNSRRGGRPSVYSTQLRMKQMIQKTYLLKEGPFRRLFQKAQKQRGSTADNLMILLESRLDNVVYRMGFASTRAQARQFVSHCHFLVNGEKVNIPSVHIKAGDTITVRDKSKTLLAIKSALDLSEQNESSCAWINTNATDMSGLFEAQPDVSIFSDQFQVDLVVEFYSK